MLQDCHGNTQGHLRFSLQRSDLDLKMCSFFFFSHHPNFVSEVLLCLQMESQIINSAFFMAEVMFGGKVNFSGAPLKAWCLTVSVGVGKATFSGLYSSLLHLDFILALPSTSSDRRRVYPTVCLACHLRGGLSEEAEGRDACRCRGLVGGENSQCVRKCLLVRLSPLRGGGEADWRGGRFCRNLNCWIWPERWAFQRQNVHLSG